jgi:hypothetical protein
MSPTDAITDHGQVPVDDEAHLRSSSISDPDLHFLLDDASCIKRLLLEDQGHPHMRLAFIWNLVFEWCDQNHRLGVDTWLRIIEGDPTIPDVWLWENGDEEWIGNNISVTFSEGSSGEHIDFYPDRLRFAVSQLSRREWDRARCALEGRLARSHVLESGIKGPPAIRIRILAWLCLISGPMEYADRQRGFMRQYRQDLAQFIAVWNTSAHSLLPLPQTDQDIDEPDINGCSCGPTKPFYDIDVFRDWLKITSKSYYGSEVQKFCLDANYCWNCAVRFPLFNVNKRRLNLTLVLPELVVSFRARNLSTISACLYLLILNLLTYPPARISSIPHCRLT